MLRDESGIQNTNSDQKSSTAEEDAALQFSPAISEKAVTSSLCQEMSIQYYTERKT